MKLKYMLDTNICIYIVKYKPKSVKEKFSTLAVGEASMSIITFAELLYGAEKSLMKEKIRNQLFDLAELIEPLHLTEEVAKHYAQIRIHLEKDGKPIGNNDLLIASHARALNLTLVTNDSEFSRVPNLKLENWAK